MTSEASHSAISSPEEGSGQSHSEWLDGETKDLFGPALAPASPSRRRAKEPEQMIQGICGRTFIGSSVPPASQDSDLLHMWESRLRERLATIGSTESALIWRTKVSPRELLISRLAVSTLHTNGTGSTGSQWSTPRASDGEKGGPNQSFTAGGQPLPAQMHQASPMVTPSARDWKDSPGMATSSGDRNRIDQLPRQMAQEPQAMWATTSVVDSTSRGYQMSGGRKFLSLPGQMDERLSGPMEPTGPTPNGSSATTEKRGAPNPAFAFWLMGFPAEWISGALAAMRSYRKQRRKSSRR